MKKLPDMRIAIIGVGNIGRILLERLLSVRVPSEHLVVCDSDLERASEVAMHLNVRAASLEDREVCCAEVLLLATSPKAVLEVLQELTSSLRPGQLVVSFAAAVPHSLLESLVPPGVAVARVMPNAPSLVGRGMNPVAFSDFMEPGSRELVEGMLESLGAWVVVPDERMNWCVGLTGAAMRTVLPVLEGLQRAGEEAGFTYLDARWVAARVVQGTAALLSDTTLSFEAIKDLTPMETVDEAALSQLIFDATLSAKEKVDRLEMKILSG